MRRFVLVASAAIALLAGSLFVGTSSASAATQRCRDVQTNHINAYVCIDYRLTQASHWYVDKIRIWNHGSYLLRSRTTQEGDRLGDECIRSTKPVTGYSSCPGPYVLADMGQYIRVCLDTRNSDHGARVIFKKFDPPTLKKAVCPNV